MTDETPDLDALIARAREAYRVAVDCGGRLPDLAPVTRSREAARAAIAEVWRRIEGT